MTDEYFAGLFDGEGCVSITQRKQNRNKFDVRLTIGVADKHISSLLKEKYGGNTRIDKRIKNGKPCRDIYIWNVVGFKSTEFLRKIKPFVIIKKIQVEAALALREIQENFQFRKPKHISGKFIIGHGLTKEEFEDRLKLKKIVKEANYGKQTIIN